MGNRTAQFYMRHGFYGLQFPHVPKLRRCLTLIALLLAAPCMMAPDLVHSRESGDEFYQPEKGQSGKHVIWIPTPDEMVMEMLRIAAVRPDDLVFDLGAGDGKIVIAAAREFGARGVGIEYNPDLAALAERNAQRDGVGEKVTIIRGDIFKEDFSKATVVALYLLPDLNLRLKPAILAMPPGTRVVSHSFDMGDWRPDAEIRTAEAWGYFWVVPARAEGRWSGRRDGQSADVTMDFKQHYQTIEGTITIGTHSTEIRAGLLRGKALSFSFVDESGRSTTAAGVVEGTTLQGLFRTAEEVTGFLASMQS